MQHVYVLSLALSRSRVAAHGGQVPILISYGLAWSGLQRTGGREVVDLRFIVWRADLCPAPDSRTTPRMFIVNATIFRFFSMELFGKNDKFSDLV